MENRRKYFINMNNKNLIQEDESGRRTATAKLAFENDTPMEDDEFVDSITSSPKFSVVMHDFINKGTYFRMIGDVKANDLKEFAINLISPLASTYIAACGEESLEDFRNSIENVLEDDGFWDGILEQYKKKRGMQ